MMIEVRAVSKIFSVRRGPDVIALQDVSLEIEHGEIVTIVGPSGCGKSTLLRMIAGLVGPGDGEVVIDGVRVTAPRSDTGIVFQSPTPAAVGDRARKCPLSAKDDERVPTRQRGACARAPKTRWLGGVRAARTTGTIRRNAAAGGYMPGLNR
jgi:ABC-type cobalamin/Fe3+-siderophores transport system ATPase subunit